MDIDRVIPKFTWRGKRPRVVKTILKKNKAEGLTVLDLKTYYTAIVIRMVVLAENHDQSNVGKRAQKQTHINSHLLFGKGTTMEQDRLFNKWSWNNWTSTCRKKNCRLKPSTKINSKWIIDLTCKIQNHKTSRRKQEKIYMTLGMAMSF